MNRRDELLSELFSIGLYNNSICSKMVNGIEISDEELEQIRMNEVKIALMKYEIEACMSA